MNAIDLAQPVQAGALFALSVSAFLIILGMDLRKVKPGQVKMMPWTFMTILAVLAMMVTGKLLFDALLPPIHR